MRRILKTSSHPDSQHLRLFCCETEEHEKSVRIAKDMHLFLLQNRQISEGAVGLACNQLGLQGRVVLMRTGNKKTWETFVNPNILSYGEETIVHEESCLSVPKKSVKVERHTQITIRYDRYDDKIIRELHGQEAIVMQHEFDHLNGILITDKEQDEKQPA